MSFNVVIDSNDKFSGTNIVNYKYALDWSFLEQSEDYDLTFSFVVTGEKSYEQFGEINCIALSGLGTQILT